MAASLKESFSLFADKMSECIKSQRSILVTTHIDCDGLTSGSIITKALIRAGAKCTVRTAKEFSKDTAESFSKDSRNFHIVTDLGGGFAGDLNRTLGEDWFILDHHQIPDTEMDNPNVINAWRHGIDGGMDICAGGMAYLAAVSLDRRNEDMAAMAVVSALGDRQDQGERKSFTGKNFEIAETAKNLGMLEVDLDLLLVGRETKSLPDALAFTSQPFIDGLTWNRAACLSILNSSGVKLKDGGRWRVPAEIDEDEKKKVIESICRFVSGRNATEIASEMIGYTYTFPMEDRRSFLREGREFSTMLNSCGRIGRPSVGISICMGDRNKALKEAEVILKEYRSRIREYMNTISNERWRTIEGDGHVMINAQGVVPEMMTGTIASLIAGSPKNIGKVIILRADGDGNAVKFSSRKAIGCTSDVNLSRLMGEGARSVGGVGGGHSMAAGAKITKDRIDEFLNYLEENIAVSGADSPK